MQGSPEKINVQLVNSGFIYNPAAAKPNTPFLLSPLPRKTEEKKILNFNDVKVFSPPQIIKSYLIFKTKVVNLLKANLTFVRIDENPSTDSKELSILVGLILYEAKPSQVENQWVNNEGVFSNLIIEVSKDSIKPHFDLEAQ